MEECRLATLRVAHHHNLAAQEPFALHRLPGVSLTCPPLPPACHLTPDGSSRKQPPLKCVILAGRAWGNCFRYEINSIQKGKTTCGHMRRVTLLSSSAPPEERDVTTHHLRRKVAGNQFPVRTFEIKSAVHYNNSWGKKKQHHCIEVHESSRVIKTLNPCHTK